MKRLLQANSYRWAYAGERGIGLLPVRSSVFGVNCLRRAIKWSVEDGEMMQDTAVSKLCARNC